MTSFIKRHPVLMFVISLLVVVGSLNYSGFCYKQMRYISDAELIEMSIQFSIDHREKFAKRWPSVEMFLEENPECCSVAKYEGSSFIDRITGNEIVDYIVDANFLGAKDKDRFYIVSRCGHIGLR